MPDVDKTKAQLISELDEMRLRLADLEALETGRKQAEEALRESAERYKTLTEDAPIGIYLSGFGGKFLYGNKKAEEIIGSKREELLGKSFLKLKLLDTKGVSKGIKLLALNKLGKATGPDDFILHRKDGAKRIVEIRTRVVNADGKKVVLGMVEDITGRKRAEEEFENIFNLSPDMVGVFTTEGGLIRVNPFCEAILGYKTEELLEMGWATLVHPDDVERTNKEVEK